MFLIVFSDPVQRVVLTNVNQQQMINIREVIF